MTTVIQEGIDSTYNPGKRCSAPNTTSRASWCERHRLLSDEVMSAVTAPTQMYLRYSVHTYLLVLRTSPRDTCSSLAWLPPPVRNVGISTTEATEAAYENS